MKLGVVWAGAFLMTAFSLPAAAGPDCSRLLSMLEGGEVPEAAVAGSCQDFVAGHLRRLATDERGRCDAAWRLTGYAVQPSLRWGALFGRLSGGLSRSEIVRRREAEMSADLKGLAGWADREAKRRGLDYSFFFEGERVRLFPDASMERSLGEFLWLVPDDDEWHGLYHAALAGPPGKDAMPLLFMKTARYSPELASSSFIESIHLLSENGEVLRTWPLMDAADDVLGISSTGKTLYLGVRLSERYGEDHTHLPLAVSEGEFRFVEPSPALQKQVVEWSGPGELIGDADYCQRGTVRTSRTVFQLARCGLSL